MTSRPMRLGDAERDAAASALSEHYAAGRLTKPEYDDRLGAVWAAKFDADLRPLFVDLPNPGPVPDVRRATREPVAPRVPAGPSGSARGHGMLWLAPLALLAFGALVFAGLRGAPWLLLIAFWLFMAGGFGGMRGRHGRGHWHRR